MQPRASAQLQRVYERAIDICWGVIRIVSTALQETVLKHKPDVHFPINSSAIRCNRFNELMCFI
jgi:hypothetical protein